MDKVLKYKFWILSGLVVPLALAGFFMANGGLQTATAERVSALDALQAPNPNQPNDTFTVVAAKRADEQEVANARQLIRLDSIQKKWMHWPKLIEDGLERDAETGKIVYRGENLRQDRIRVQYPDVYKQEHERVWLSFNPVVPSGLPYSEDTQRKVFFDKQAMPIHVLPQTPTVEEIWDAQEDLWILEMISQAVNQTNQAATDVNDAAIREIFYLELFGGSGESSVVASADGGAEGGYMDFGGMDYMGESGGGPAGAALSVPFASGAIGHDPAMEYGSAAGLSGGGGESFDGMYMGGDGGLFGGSGGTSAKPLRYVGFDEENPGPYRKRGYYLSLLIEEKRIPDFVVNLANLDPPIAAGRWGFANNPYDSDHLLKSGFAGVGQGQGGYADTPYGGGGFSGASRTPRRGPKVGGSSPYGSESYGGETYGATGPGMRPNPNDPSQRPLTPKQQDELATLEAAKLDKDLVQLELSGVVTIFTPDVPELPAVEEADATVPSAETPPQVSEPVAPAAASGVAPNEADGAVTGSEATSPAPVSDGADNAGAPPEADPNGGAAPTEAAGDGPI